MKMMYLIIALTMVLCVMLLLLLHSWRSILNSLHKCISEQGDLIEEQQGDIKALEERHISYWKEHWENYAIAVLRVFGKDVSLRNGDAGAVEEHKNAVMFLEPLTVTPKKGESRTVTIYGMSYDPDLDFIRTRLDLQAEAKANRAAWSAEAAAAVETAEDENERRFIEWASGSALIKGSHLGLRLITSKSRPDKEEAEFGLMHFDCEAIVKIINYLRREVIGEDEDISKNQ